MNVIPGLVLGVGVFEAIWLHEFTDLHLKDATPQSPELSYFRAGF